MPPGARPARHRLLQPHPLQGRLSSLCRNTSPLRLPASTPPRRPPPACDETPHARLSPTRK
eukprot:2241589-Pyramimonas_sp.AAC.1